ncbi:hypothetical protein [Pseudomonas sp. NFR16]|uniref:hypothetical protein n=1 Tax=Pseudomonas sp. NFR16 TaxID=1566248 RepID=UPI0008B331A2|nr:hypothetical protein [Pseudomonas sp. NFR16]SEJ03798.1 hypothetical protein SAMN03159495_2076 [Pseudomonas sp. NFR16]
MDKDEVRQHVDDALGKILVDKTLIQEDGDPRLTEFMLEEEDVVNFLEALRSDSNIPLPKDSLSEFLRAFGVRDTEEAHHGEPQSTLTAEGLVELIVKKMKG